MKTYSYYLILFTSVIITSCNNNKNDDLGIIPNKIETYFYSDTTYDYQTISIYPKYHLDSLYYRPYSIGFKYGKELDEKNASWKLNFSPSHYDKYVNVYPSKGILKIDDEEIVYGNASAIDAVSEENTLFVYVSSSKLTEEEIINKLANAKTVKFIAIGHDKQEFTWSPKIIEDSKNTLKYYESLKTNVPDFD